MSIFREADGLSLPSSLLIDRLNLGVARRLSPPALSRGMRQELARLRTALDVLTSVEREPSGAALLEGTSRAVLLNTVSIYLSGGLSPDLIGALLSEAGSAHRRVDDVFLVCAALLRVDRAGDFTNRELLGLGTALIDSSLAPSGYAAVGSFIARSAATGRGGSSLLPTVERILRQGGGLPQMELELGRRR